MTLPIAFGIPMGPELWLILLVILLLFGGKKIPELMRGLGKGMGELHKGLEEGRKAMEKTAEPEPEKPAPAESTSEKDRVADGNG